MEKIGIKAQYLFNSGFLIETKNYQLLFDYYKGSINLANKNTFIFSSHSHPDHFNPEILQFGGTSQNIRYILSSDINIENPDKSIHFMSPDEVLKIEGVRIKTSGSTDIGVSFLVEADGIKLFHAGDLNWWYWWDDTPEEIRTMEEAFKNEIAKLRVERIDVAFFPVDPRLRHNYSLGGEYFIKEIKPAVFVPMHFGEDYEAVKNFALKVKEYPVEVVQITAKGQNIYL